MILERIDLIPMSILHNGVFFLHHQFPLTRKNMLMQITFTLYLLSSVWLSFETLMQIKKYFNHDALCEISIRKRSQREFKSGPPRHCK